MRKMVVFTSIVCKIDDVTFTADEFDQLPVEIAREILKVVTDNLG
jgi:hypothetical protein